MVSEVYVETIEEGIEFIDVDNNAKWKSLAIE